MNLFKKLENKIMKQSDLIPEGNPVLNQKALFLGKGKIIFGQNVNIGYFPSPYFYSTYAHIEARNESSKILIEDDTYINNNCCIISNGEVIHIGKNCRVGMNFLCVDSDFHGLNVEIRDNLDFIINKSVNIGNNVFIGSNVIILKGVSLGNGCVVGAGSVVTKSFPDNSVIAGNPAGIIKTLDIKNRININERV